ncbi:MAG: tRNA pseudouridine(55) synthase TruB [Clostridia bacterium]|nr:tRNA pseudouridine(55) synthase TruB [Clostridia bacterium]
MNGFLNLFKPKGVSSAYVLNAVKRSIRGEVVGHMGTLDPLASGVLPVAIGKSARLFDYLLDKKKVYVAVFTFGYQTDTLDLEGKVEQTCDFIPDLERVKKESQKLVGDIMQVPPVYSAKCVKGKRSYELARKGEKVKLPPKKVTINKIEVLEQISKSEFKLKIECKGGTYIRSIARDLGVLCSSCATMTALERVESGIFNIENSVNAEDFVKSNDKESFLIAPENVVDFPSIFLNEKQTERLFNGLYDIFDYKDGTYRVFCPSGFYGVGEMKDGKLKVKAYVRT